MVSRGRLGLAIAASQPKGYPGSYTAFEALTPGANYRVPVTLDGVDTDGTARNDFASGVSSAFTLAAGSNSASVTIAANAQRDAVVITPPSFSLGTVGAGTVEPLTDWAIVNLLG